LLGFLIPLKSKAVSFDWALTQALLRQTLASTSQQSCKAFHTVVVCHDRPNLGPLSTAQIKIVEVAFPPPAERTALLMRRDKERKLELGLDYLAQLGCDWVMKLDADDLIARDVCAFINHAASDAVIFKKGIVWSMGSNWYLSESTNFHRICGTCFALRRGFMLQDDGQRGRLFDFFISDHHERIEDICRENSISVLHPGFPAACYVRHLDLALSKFYHPNHNLTVRERLGLIRRLRRLRPSVREQFGMLTHPMP
jgi:hypothetical protein